MAPRAVETPLRVLHLITDLGRGGAERFLLDLCQALRGRPDVAVVIGSLIDDNRYPELSDGLPIRQLHYRPFSFLRPHDNQEYRALLEEFQPHVVHTHRYLAEFLSALHVRDGVTYVCHGHDNMIQFARPGVSTLLSREGRANWMEKRWLIRKKYRRTRTRFVANSEHTKRYFQAMLPGPMRDDVHLIRYGFDYARFHASTRPAPPPGGPLRLVNVGSFQAKKNQGFIVSIAQELADAGVDFQVDLLGDGELRPAVEDEVARRGLAGRVHFRGNVERVEEWLWRSHVYLHTAWYEPFGLVLLEAMAAGLPCVVLDGQGSRDLIQDGRNGFLLTDQDASAFARRIQELATSPELHASLSSHAQEYARKFDIHDAAQAFVDFYRRCRSER